MRYYTHLTTSVCAGTFLASQTNIDISGGFLAGIAIGSLLPDIDHQQSFIGRRAILISKLFQSLFKHRGFTHSLFAYFFFVILHFLFSTSFSLGLSIGFLFHILGDFFSKTGVPLLQPLSRKRFKIPLYKTGGITEHFSFFASIFIFFHLFYN